MKEVTDIEAKLIRLELLKELDRFCTENSIHYYLGFGTLIGAIRHNGFIPWDDDCDIIIPRPDLRKLESLYKINGNYELITNRGKNSHIYGFDRLVDNRTYQQVGRFQVQGVNIELYPIDGCPTNELLCKWYLWLMHKMFKVEDRIFHKAYGLAKIYQWNHSTLKPWWVRWYIRLYYFIGSFFNYYKSQNVAIMFGNMYKLRTSKNTIFGEGKKHQFESYKFMIPDDYDSFLRMYYGDYMTPPPPEKQIPSHGGNLYWY